MLCVRCSRVYIAAAAAAAAAAARCSEQLGGQSAVHGSLPPSQTLSAHRG